MICRMKSNVFNQTKIVCFATRIVKLKYPIVINNQKKIVKKKYSVICCDNNTIVKLKYPTQ